MKTIRRLYFYAVTFISLEVILWLGMIGLLRSILKPNTVVDYANALATPLAVLIVGLPIFLFHWLWSQRTAAKDEEEKTANLRAIFFYGILLATLIPAVQNLLALINRIFLSTANLYTSRAIVGGSQTWVDNLIAVVINLLIAAYFWSILRDEWPTLPNTESFSETRRLYRFIWVLYGLLLIIYGSQQALTFTFTFPNNVLGQIGRETAINAIALLVVGTPIWFYSWSILQNVLTDSAEKESMLRLGILYLLTLGGVITALTAGGNLIFMLLHRVFGDNLAWSKFLQQIGGPISLGVPFGVMWAYYGKWLNHQINFDEQAPRRAGKKRIYFYILSLIGLVASFTGIALLLSFVVDRLTGNAYLDTGGFGISLANALSTLLIGLPLWLSTWRPMQAEALGQTDLSDHARRSIIRKVYLYLALFAGVIGGMVSAVYLVYTLINAGLGGDSSNFAKSTLDSLQVLVLFIVLLLYHLSALRKDGAAHTDALEAKQSQFNVLVFDNGTHTFGEAMKSMLAKRTPMMPILVINASEEIPRDVKANAIVLPASLAVNLTGNIAAWIHSFSGSRLIVNDEAAGVYWMNDFEQVAEAVQTLAEEQEIRPQSARRTTSVWSYVIYIFAGLFALELFFILITFAVSLVTSF
ncbi:MAG: DUF5671 domain-containing protein [Anaerolineales bacterium]